MGMSTTLTSSAFATAAVTETTSNVNNRDVLIRQYVSAPLTAQTITGTLKGQVQISESNASANMLPQIVVNVVSKDGTTVRGTLYGGDTRTTNVDELTTALRNQRIPATGVSPVTLTSVTAQDGDRIVVEIGVRAQNTSNTNYTATANFGDSGASDLTEGGAETTNLNPWVELSANLTFQTGLTPFRDEVVADSPSAYWRLAEAPAGGGAGSVAGLTAVDETANANNGTYQNTNTWGGYAGAIVNDPNTSVFFNALGSYVSIPHSTSLNFADTFTLEIWFKRRTLATAQYFMGKGANAPTFWINASNQLVLDQHGVATVVISTVTVADATMWHHAVVTKTGATVKLYIDGIDRTGTVTNRTMLSNALAFGIGQSGPSAGVSFYDGWLDEAVVYPTALSAARVLAHFQAGLEGAAPSGPANDPIPLTGVDTDEQLGTLTTSPGTATQALSGVATDEQLGTLTPAPGLATRTLVGVATDETVGTLTPQASAVSVSLTGVATDEQVGVLTATPVNPPVALTGVATDELLGTLTTSPGTATRSLTGVATDESVGALTPVPASVSQALTGVPTDEIVPVLTAVAGGVSRALSGVATDEQVGALTPVPGVATRVLGGVATDETIGGVTAQAGSVSVALTGVATDELAGSVTATQGANPAISLTGVATDELVGTLVPVPGTATRALSGVATDESVGALGTTASGVVVSLTGVPTDELVGTLTTSVAGNTRLLTGVSTDEIVGSLTAIPGGAMIVLAGLTSDELVGLLTPLAGTVVVPLVGVGSDELVGVITSDIAGGTLPRHMVRVGGIDRTVRVGSTNQVVPVEGINHLIRVPQVQRVIRVGKAGQ